MRVLLPALALFGAAVASTAMPQSLVSDAAVVQDASPKLLSEFGLFDGGPDKPNAALIRYRLRTPLFSDYAEKERFIYLPKGAMLEIDRYGRVAFPVGSALVKSFGYPDATGNLNVIETRLLLHRKDGWVALPYVWRADKKDAELRVGGTRVPVSFTTPKGQAMQISYAVPNKNQCKQCHSSADAIMPIGPVLQNMQFSTPADRARLLRNAMLSAVAPVAQAAWDDPKARLADRAEAYLRVNCAHCHSPKGSASNSGLFFDRPVSDAVAYGVGKRPVAAGRGAGDNDFVIAPGQPDKSILIYRMKSTDPGIAMPELGRGTVDAEGVDLLSQWIATMR